MDKEEEKSVEVVEEQPSWLEDKLSTITDGLDTYAGRDAVIVLLSYLPLFAADFCTFTGFGEERDYAQAFVNMFLALSSCRIMLRLFDDCGCIREYIRFSRAQRIKVSIEDFIVFCCLNPFPEPVWHVFQLNDPSFFLYFTVYVVVVAVVL